MDQIRYLDTYILCEIARQNPKFMNLLDSEIIINDLTLTEFYSVIFREHNEITADYWLNKLRQYRRTVPLEILIKAIKFKKEHAKKNISFFDAVGYIFAKENNGVFVTGDKEFEGMKCIEFIKK